jgi:hypothetical protein
MMEINCKPQYGRRELDASDRRQPSMKRQTAAPPTQSVQVTNIPLPVKVANPPLAVTVISGEQVNAFHEVSDLSNQVNNPVFTIPTGKRLVIEYLSAKGTVPAGDSVSGIHINNPVVHFFTVTAQGTDGSGKSVFAAAQSFHTTIGPFPVPTDVLVRMERNMFGPGTEAVLSVSLAGQLLHP